MLSMRRLCFCLLLVPLLAACTQPMPLPKPSEPDPQQLWIQQMLVAAELAFSENRLMIPVNDNAFDRYRQILDIAPDNAEAQLGLKKICRRYLTLANEAAHGGDLVAAQRYVDRARKADPSYEALDHMESYLDLLVEEQRKERARQAKPRVSKKNEYWLDVAAVNARSPAMVEQLHAIAKEVRALDTRFEIIARSDPEGRWIYQTMRDAVSDYRLRANLERGNAPRIILIDVQE
jgi:hypothetical protein